MYIYPSESIYTYQEIVFKSFLRERIRRSGISYPLVRKNRLKSIILRIVKKLSSMFELKKKLN